MTVRSDLPMQGALVDRERQPVAAKPSAAIASRLTELQSAGMRRVGRRRLVRSIAHLDDRLLADIGLSAEDPRRQAFGWPVTSAGRAVPVAWTVKDSKGELLPRFIAGSPREVGRKVVPNRYDAFRLEVSPSYRELFDRDLKSVLAREEWQIVPVKRRRRCNDAQLEFMLN